MQPVIPRAELLRIMTKFMADPHRGISVKLFAELSGISLSTMKDVFIKHELPLTEYIQRRVSKAYESWLRGEIAIMQNRDATRFVEFRKKPRPKFVRSVGLEVVNGQIKVRVGITNTADYSGYDLDEQLKGKNNG
jgi:hypothetical protein